MMSNFRYIHSAWPDGDGSTLTLDFTTGQLDPRLTFTRSTTGTYINSSGYVASAAINTPRFDYDPITFAPRGLAIEGSATNLCLRSSDFNTTVNDGTNWTASGYTTAATSTTLPDGTTGNALRISIASGSGSVRSTSLAVSQSTTYTWSFWARNNGGSQARFRVWNATAGSSIVDYSQTVNNYVSQIGGANNTSSTWVRVSVTFTTPAGCTAIYVYPTSSDSGTVDMFVWGAQVEAGSGASSYIPTGASTATRAADIAVVSGTGFSGWYTGGTSGTFLVEFNGSVRTGPGSSTTRTIISTDGVSTKQLQMTHATGANPVKITDFAATSVTTGNSLTSGARSKAAFSYSGGSVNACLNGGAVASGTLSLSAAPTWLSIGAISADGSTISDANAVLNSTIRSIKYWPTAQSNSFIQAITT